MNSDRYSMEIMDGMKTIVCKLKPNSMGFTSIGYPTDETPLPNGTKNFLLIVKKWSKESLQKRLKTCWV